MRPIVKISIIGGCLSTIFILLTAYGAQHGPANIIGDFCMFLHFIPFAAGFTGSAKLIVYIYYVFLWVVITGFFSAFTALAIRLIKKNKNGA